jgi:hypothetical protein
MNFNPHPCLYLQKYRKICVIISQIALESLLFALHSTFPFQKLQALCAAKNNLNKLDVTPLQPAAEHLTSLGKNKLSPWDGGGFGTL